jgi:hypothetical protein
MKAPPLLYVIAQYWRECPRHLQPPEDAIRAGEGRELEVKLSCWLCMSRAISHEALPLVDAVAKHWRQCLRHLQPLLDAILVIEERSVISISKATLDLEV